MKVYITNFSNKHFQHVNSCLQSKAKLWLPWQQKAPIDLIWGKRCLRANTFSFDPIFIKVAGNEDGHKISDEFEFWPDQTTPFGVRCPLASKNFLYTYNRKNMCLQASTFIFDRICDSESKSGFCSITLTAVILFRWNLHNTLPIIQCTFGRQMGTEGSVLQELCLSVILTMRCLYYDW